MYQDGVKPQMFKNLIGKGHEEFSSRRQQDALEYFFHLLTTLERADRTVIGPPPFPGNQFSFIMCTRLQCATCGGVKYKDEKFKHLTLRMNVTAEQDSETLRVEFADMF